MILPNVVLLCKSQVSEDDKYQELLQASGYQVIQIKTLVFEFKHLSVLEEKLKNIEDFSGIIFSSPRCVNAVKLLNNSKDLCKKWVTKHNFAVGEATYKAALENLGLECLGKESGNAVNLSKIIISKKEQYLFEKPFLFPHGNLKTDTLNLELSKAGIGIEGVLVYDTIANPDIENDLRKVTKNYSCLPEYIVIFSPSGLRSTINHIRKVAEDFDKVQFVAIGPVTELAMQEDNLNMFAVAHLPTPESLVNAILKQT